MYYSIDNSRIQSISSEKRLVWPDIVKGIGIIMVVLYHALIPELRNNSPLAFLVWRFLGNIHMPLFFFVSGWLFELKVNKYISNKSKTIWTKFRHLMIPYFTFSIFYYILIAIASGISYSSTYLKIGGTGVCEQLSLSGSILQILTFQNSRANSLWFVYVLFIISTLNILFPKIMRAKFTLIALFVLPYINYILESFLLKDLLTYLTKNIAYFTLARICVTYYKSRIIIKKKNSLPLIGAIFIICNSIYTYLTYKEVFNAGFLEFCNIPIRYFVAIFGIIFFCILSNYINRFPSISKVLQFLGSNSFVIYLVHAPILTQVVVLCSLKFLPTFPIFFHCILGLAVGLTVPLLISKLIIEKVEFLKIVLLGDNINLRIF